MDTRPTSPGPTSTSPPSHDRLDGWKEIASYLRRDIRTAQRWEATEELPIHRRLNAKHNSVFAYRTELDDWWRNRHPLLQKERQESKSTNSPAVAPTHLAAVRLLLYASACLVIVLTVMTGKFLFASYDKISHNDPAHRFSLAVLPFENLSAYPDDLYIANGLTDDLASYLGRIPSLRVISLGPVYPRANSDSSLREIAEQLHVDGLVAGSLSRTGDTIQVTTRLFEPGATRDTWNIRLETTPLDALSMQSDLAGKIAHGISSTLLPNDPPLSSSHPVNPQARLDYLKGRYYWDQGKPALVNDALGYFDRAVTEDPHYAPAYSSLADSYFLLSLWGFEPASENPAGGKFAAMKSEELQPTASASHASAGYALGHYDWNLQAADRELREAIDLNPSDAIAHEWRGDFLVSLGQFAEGISELKEALALRPVFLAAHLDLANAFFLERKYAAAIRELQDVLQEDRDSVPALTSLGTVMEFSRDYSGARDSYEKLAGLTGNKNTIRDLDILITAERGDVSSARQSFHELLLNSRGHSDAEFRAAVLAAEMNYKEGALDALAKACDDHSPKIVELKVHPAFDSLHSEPRFQALERKVGLSP